MTRDTRERARLVSYYFAFFFLKLKIYLKKNNKNLLLPDCSTEMAFPASARTTFKGILLDAEETITRTATSHRDSGGGGGGGLSAASTCEDDKRLPAEDLTCRESCCSRWNSTGTASAAAPSSSSIITRRLHVANRVTDSPWKQLARPHHSPRIQPIVLQQHQNSTTINPSVSVPHSLFTIIVYIKRQRGF